MKANQLLVLTVAAATGCGEVLPLPSATTGDDDGSGSNTGSGDGSDLDPPGSHPPGTIYGHVKDERGDTIDYSTNVPIHTHAGPSVDLSTDCQPIYKYAYLESAHGSRFGIETTPNPIAFKVQADPSSIESSEYRVRAADDSVLLDWTTMTADDAGVFTMELHPYDSAKMAALATDGEMHIDARFHDTSGTELVTSRCWTNRALSAPLQIITPQTGALFGDTLAGAGNVADLVNAIGLTDSQYGEPVASIPITQFTDQATTATIRITPPTGQATATIATLNAAGLTSPANYSCGTSKCPNAGSTSREQRNAALNASWQLVILDSAGNVAGRSSASDPFTATISIPARTAQPISYTAVLSIGGEKTIGPLGNVSLSEGTYSRYQFATQTMIGVATGSAVSMCSHQALVAGAAVWVCDQATSYTPMKAIGAASIALDPIALVVTFGTQTSALTLPGQTWNGGATGL